MTTIGIAIITKFDAIGYLLPIMGVGKYNLDTWKRS